MTGFDTTVPLPGEAGSGSPQGPSGLLAHGPLGLFDSGLGGLSVIAEIRRRLPDENLVYVADSCHAPYGNKPASMIVQRSRNVSAWLLASGAKAIVIACNTATAVAADSLRRELPVPVIAMEPAVKPAAAATRNRVVGVLATSGTLGSARFAALLQRYAADMDVITQPCPGLVEAVERNAVDSAETGNLLDRYLAPLIAARADTIILGCTHYPFLRDQITRRLPPDTVVIDTGAAVARQLQRRLAESGLLAASGSDRKQPGQLTIWTTGDHATAAAFIKTHGVSAASVRPLRGV